MLIFANSLNFGIFWICLWIFIFIAALVVEFLTEQLVSIWFSGASLISFILALCKIDGWIQIVVFIISAIILVAFSRKFVNKVLQKDIPTNSDSLIGQEILVTKSVSKTQKGEGKIRDIVWSLVSDQDNIIKNGEYAIIKEIKGNKLIVERKEK